MEQGMFELVAAWVAVVAGLASPLAAPAKHQPQVAAVTAGRTSLTAADGKAAIEAATRPVKADATTWRWGCQRPMTIRPAAGPGVSISEVQRQLEYPVAALRALGYDVTVGAPIPYRRDAEEAMQRGRVDVVVTAHAREQVELDGKSARTIPNLVGRQALSATVILDADPKVGVLAGDILLHELGHVIGLDHKDGTVMAESWTAPAGFDAAEVAAVDCR